MKAVKTIIGRLMEAERAAVNPDEIYESFDRLSSVIEGIPREFVFNVDETECSDHSDSRDIRVIVPMDYSEPWVPVAYDRPSKRSIFVASIAADRFSVKSFAIVH
jgi:hypothetical protein